MGINVDSINYKENPSSDDYLKAPGYIVRKISPEEVRAYKRIHLLEKYKGHAIRVGVFVLTSFVLVVGSYVFLNYESLSRQIAFDEPDNMGSFVEKRATIAEQSVSGQSVAGSSVDGSIPYTFVASDQRLEIPKLNVIGNIIYPKSSEEVDKVLDKGIVHLPQSVLPGNIGNSILTAHSSSLRGGYYSSIFSTLNRLQNGDVFFLYRGKEVFAYKVFGQEVVGPRIEYLKKANGEEMLTLVTCWPIGSDEKRLAVYAKRIN